MEELTHIGRRDICHIVNLKRAVDDACDGASGVVENLLNVTVLIAPSIRARSVNVLPTSTHDRITRDSPLARRHHAINIGEGGARDDRQRETKGLAHLL